METILRETAEGLIVRTDDNGKWLGFIKSMVAGNTYLPEVVEVLFNLKTYEMKPVLGADGKPVLDEKERVQRQKIPVTPELATIIRFADGTKCTVVNSDKDAVTTEEKEVTYFDYDAAGKKTEIKTGAKVRVASEAAKEAGILYAIVKRLFGKVDNDPKSRTYGQVKGDGFGRKLRELCDSAYDTQYVAAVNEEMKKEMKKQAAKEHKAREDAAKARRANRAPTIEENIATLVKQNTELLEKLAK